ncbi:unnamed protein product [Orchesella dallaii]|uniref:Uncharacterized protein n=1 Tax=Orchesella dallaii TaxID=48710 RepID=A0ABP1RJL4_9HEXA
MACSSLCKPEMLPYVPSRFAKSSGGPGWTEHHSSTWEFQFCFTGTPPSPGFSSTADQSLLFLPGSQHTWMSMMGGTSFLHMEIPVLI